MLLEKTNEREDISAIHDKLESYSEFIKKFAEDMKRKEASKVRKLQSQIRSRKLLDRNRKKLQFESKGSQQIQTDYLHHTQGPVMTRKQITSL